jgi:hypothetical protein
MKREGPRWDQKCAAQPGAASDAGVRRPERSGERPLSLAIARVGSHRAGISAMSALGRVVIDLADRLLTVAGDDL